MKDKLADVVFIENTFLMSNSTCRSNLRPNKRDKKEEFITASGLKERGWTKKLIDTFLQYPDKIETNPVYKSAKPMKLYSLDRVKKAERRKKFKEEFEKAKKRKASARKGVETRVSNLLDWIDSIEIKIPLIDQDKLIDIACKSYNEWQEYKAELRDYECDYKCAAKDSDPEFIARICRNYLRHQCTSYERQLHKMYGKAGVQEGHDILQNRINDRINSMYPFIGDYSDKG